MKIYFSTKVESNLQYIKSKFTRELFLFLAPPFIPIKLIRFDGCSPGDEVHLKMGLFLKDHLFLGSEWISLITEEKCDKKQWYFIDEGSKLPWPLKKWKHIHGVKAGSENVCTITDHIEFTSGFFLVDIFMYPFL